jgi:beta-galactosidase/beta-glucuronidase
VELAQRVRRWNDQREVGSPICQAVKLAAGEKKTIQPTVPVPETVLWTPDNPFLYQLESSQQGFAGDAIRDA